MTSRHRLSGTSLQRPLGQTCTGAGCIAGIILLIVSFTACSPPDGTTSIPKISEDTFVEYYASFMVRSHELKLEGYDSLRIARGIDTLRRSFKIEPADIQETLEFYHQHLDRWKEFNSRLLKRLTEIQKKNGNI